MSVRQKISCFYLPLNCSPFAISLLSSQFFIGKK